MQSLYHLGSRVWGNRHHATIENMRTGRSSNPKHCGKTAQTVVESGAPPTMQHFSPELPSILHPSFARPRTTALTSNVLIQPPKMLITLCSRLGWRADTRDDENTSDVPLHNLHQVANQEDDPVRPYYLRTMAAAHRHPDMVPHTMVKDMLRSFNPSEYTNAMMEPQRQAQIVHNNHFGSQSVTSKFLMKHYMPLRWRLHLHHISIRPNSSDPGWSKFQCLQDSHHGQSSSSLSRQSKLLYQSTRQRRRLPRL